jgi:hypothetical protein
VCRNRLLALIDDEPKPMIVGGLLDRALVGAAFRLPADAALQRKSGAGRGQRAARRGKPCHSRSTPTGMHHDLSSF